MGSTRSWPPCCTNCGPVPWRPRQQRRLGATQSNSLLHIRSALDGGLPLGLPDRRRGQTNICQFIEALYDTKQLQSSLRHLPPAKVEPTYSMHEVLWPLIRWQRFITPQEVPEV